ncbi:MAG: type II toxin-antitoxin system ParD family antitoxin [Alistipes communis]
MTFSPKHSKITSEAIRAELRLLKEDESRIEALRSAIDEEYRAASQPASTLKATLRK